MQESEIIGAVEHLASDDIADLVPSLPPDVVLALLRALDRKDRTEVQTVLSFPPGSVESMRRVSTFEGDRALRQASSLLPFLRVTHEGVVRAVAFSRDGRYLATGSGDTARVVETTTGRELLRVTHADVVDAVAFSRDGRYIATGSADRAARVVETTTTGQELLRVTHEGAVAAPSPPRRGSHRRDLCTPDEEPDGRGVEAIPRRYPLSQNL